MGGETPQSNAAGGRFLRVIHTVARATTLETVGRLIRLLLVDDEEHVRKGLAMAFSAEPDLQVIGEAPDGERAVELASELHPDIVIMDLRMRRMDGLAATRRIHSDVPSARIVVLSLQDDTPTRKAAADAGARAFVGKGQASDVLVETIRRVAAAS